MTRMRKSGAYSITLKLTTYLSLLIVLFFFSSCDSTSVDSELDKTMSRLDIKAENSSEVIHREGRIVLHDSQSSGRFYVSNRGRVKSDLYFEPVQVQTDGSLAFELVNSLAGGQERVVARMTQSRDKTGHSRLVADLKELGSKTVTIQYRKGELVLRSRPNIPVGKNGQVSITLAENPPTSWHYEEIIENGQKVLILVLDYDNIQQPTDLGGNSIDLPDPETDHVVIISEVVNADEMDITGYRIITKGTGDIRIREKPQID